MTRTDKPLLERGDRGQAVEILTGILFQLELLKPEQVGKVFNYDVEGAVREFQAMRGLPNTGIVDKVVQAELDRAIKEIQ